MTRALDVAEAALRAAGGEASAVVQVESSGLARFAASEIHQPTLIENVSVTLQVVRDDRTGIAATNRIEAEGLKELAARAGAAAESAPPEPEFPGLTDPEPPPEVAGFDAETAALRPEDQARLALAAVAAAGDIPAYGFFTSAVSELAVASSTGVSAEQRLTDATTLVVAADDRRSGYAERSGWRAADADPEAVGREAAEKAIRTSDAVELEPGEYPAVLEPYALAELLAYFAYDSLGALGLMEERSYLAGRVGEHVFDPQISISDDALDPRGLPKAFDFEGTPKRRVELIRAGVAQGVVWDRTTASRAANGAATTGHAPPPATRDWGPLPYALVVEGGEAGSTEELAERVGDGIYVTRLHYLGIVDPREGVITGMTRDGTFRIRDGRIAEPLFNLRFTVPVPEVLHEVLGLTREQRLVNGSDFYGDRYPCGALVPALATARFTITGVGSAPGT